MMRPTATPPHIDDALMLPAKGTHGVVGWAGRTGKMASGLSEWMNAQHLYWIFVTYLTANMLKVWPINKSTTIRTTLGISPVRPAYLLRWLLCWLSLDMKNVSLSECNSFADRPKLFAKADVKQSNNSKKKRFKVMSCHVIVMQLSNVLLLEFSFICSFMLFLFRRRQNWCSNRFAVKSRI